MSNIIFGTSSDDIERGLHNGDFIDRSLVEPVCPGDNDMIVNEQEQNEIVNPAEENFSEDLTTGSSEEDKNFSGEKTTEISKPEEESYDDGSEDSTATSPTADN